MALKKVGEPFSSGSATKVGRIWSAFRDARLSETDLILLLAEAIAVEESGCLTPGWKIAPAELHGHALTALRQVSAEDADSLERRGVSWIAGAIDGARCLQLVQDSGEDIVFLEAYRPALRLAHGKLGCPALRWLDRLLDGSWFPYPALGRLLSHGVALVLGAMVARLLGT